MKKLYTAGDIIEAQLLNSLLKAQGISSLIKNEGLQSGVGELPFVEMWPEVWIMEQKRYFSGVVTLIRMTRKQRRVYHLSIPTNGQIEMRLFYVPKLLLTTSQSWLLDFEF